MSVAAASVFGMHSASELTRDVMADERVAAGSLKMAEFGPAEKVKADDIAAPFREEIRTTIANLKKV